MRCASSKTLLEARLKPWSTSMSSPPVVPLLLLLQCCIISIRLCNQSEGERVRDLESTNKKNWHQGLGLPDLHGDHWCNRRTG